MRDKPKRYVGQQGLDLLFQLLLGDAAEMSEKR